VVVNTPALEGILMTIQTSDVQLSVDGKTATAYLANGGGPGVLVLHSWWGLNPLFKKVANQLAEQGFTALALDLMDGKIAVTVDEAQELIKTVEDEYAGAVVTAAKDYLLEITNRKKIGAVGFSMGGWWSLSIASSSPEQVGAIAIFYGNGEADFDKLSAKVMGHFSDNDEFEPMEYVNKTFSEFEKASVDATLHVYPGVAHWFIEEDRPEYDPKAAQLAWERTYKFLKENL